MKRYDNIFNSNQTIDFISYPLANGHISLTTILFEQQQVVATIEANGRVEFMNTDDELLTTVTLPEQTGGKEVYDQVSCKVQDNMILLQFPIVEWIDNYPHCDGEHDRWDTKTIGYYTLSFDLNTKETEIQ